MFARVARLASPRALAVTAVAASSVYLISTRSNAVAACAPCGGSKSPNSVLTMRRFQSLSVRAIESVSPNTKRITLALPKAEDVSGISPVSIILLRATVNGKLVLRPYTPTSTPNTRGELELVVKSYPDGTMSKHLGELKVGDSVQVRGPVSTFKYAPNRYKHIGMVAGGSGITPMLQLARAICADPEDTTKITLLCANSTEKDMLLKDELAKLQATYPQLQVHHVLSQPSESWSGRTGHVSQDMILELMPGPKTADTLVCVCGPPGMMKHVSGEKGPFFFQGRLKGLLSELGYNGNQVVKF